MIPSLGIQGHCRGVHGPRCLPSHLPNNGKAVESRHIQIGFLHAFHVDVDARTSVGVVLMLAQPALEPLSVAVRSLRVSTHRTLPTRVFRVNSRCWDALESDLVRCVVLERTKWQVV